MGEVGGGSGRGEWGGESAGGGGGGGGGGGQVGQSGVVVVVGYQVGEGAQADLTCPCPPSKHTTTINLTLTFAATWFGHATHVN